MKQNAEEVIRRLSPEISRKCTEIQNARRDRAMTGLFLLLCAALVIVPTLFIFFGLSLTTLLAPVLFAGLAFLLLAPVLFHQQGGRQYDQI